MNFSKGSIIFANRLRKQVSNRNMAHHKSAIKRIRQSAKRRLRNRYKKTTMRSMIKKLRATEQKAEAEKMLPSVLSNIDRVAKANIIHKKTASNYKSKLTKYVNGLA